MKTRSSEIRAAIDEITKESDQRDENNRLIQLCKKIAAVTEFKFSDFIFLANCNTINQRSKLNVSDKRPKLLFFIDVIVKTLFL